LLGSKYVSSGWQFNSNTNFERIVPGGEVRTWKPELLVFGAQNLKINTLSTDPWDGIYFGVYLSKSIRELFQLAYEIQQYIPLEYNNSAESPGISDTESSSNFVKTSIYGGGKHTVYIIITL